MKAYRAKIKNRVPCRGVIGGVVEIPPDTRKGKLKKNKKQKSGSGSRQAFLFPLPRQTAVHTVYDNSNVTTPGLLRVFIVCFIFMILMMVFY